MIIDIIQKKRCIADCSAMHLFYMITINHFTGLYPETPGVLETSDD